MMSVFINWRKTGTKGTTGCIQMIILGRAQWLKAEIASDNIHYETRLPDYKADGMQCL